MTSLILKKLSSLVVPGLMLITWEVAHRLSLLPPSLSAAPSEIIARLVHLIIGGVILKHALFSIARIFTAVSFGTVLGIASGILLAQSRRADRYFSPTLRLLAPIPVVVWMPFVIMTVGAGELYKIALAVLATFFIVHIHTFQAVISIERDYLELAEIYEKSLWEKVRHVLLPAASPAIYTALRLTLAIAWIIIFFVEFASARQGSEGLGWFISDARAIGRVEDEYAGVILLGMLGYVTDWLVANIQRKSLMWADTRDIKTGNEE